MTNPRNHFRLIVAALSLAAAPVFAQNPPGAPPAAPTPPPQQGRGTPGQIAIPQPCTPEQIAAAQAAAKQPAAADAGRGRGGRGGGGTPCHMPDPREGLKPGKYLVRVTAGDGTTAVNPVDPDAGPGPSGGGTNIVSKDLVPKEWNTKSKHEITVTKEGPNTFDFDIK